MNKAKLFLFVGLSLATGFIWGLVLFPIISQCHLGPKMPLGQYDQMVSVDIIKNGDDIWVVDHKTGRLIFEYNRFKEVDKEAFGEYEGLVIEATSREK